MAIHVKLTEEKLGGEIVKYQLSSELREALNMLLLKTFSVCIAKSLLICKYLGWKSIAF